MNELDEHVMRCLAGDTDRFGDVVRSCEPRVRAVLAAMVPDHNLVPDLTQEVFLIAYRRLSSYRPGTNFPAWISAIARNVAQNERRRWYRERAAREDYQALAERQVAEEIDRFVASLPQDVLQTVRDCVGRLGGRAHALVEGYYYKDCALNQLAELMKLSASSAKVALHRAREAIGKCIRRERDEQ